MRIVIPDDYQNVIRTLDCFGRLTGHDVSIFHELRPASQDDLAARFAEADAVVLTRERTRIDAALLDRLPKLRLISQTGKVSSHLDLTACTARGVVVTEGRGSPVAPAELAWTLILNARRQLVPAIEAFKAGHWQVNLGTAVAGQTLGIWGYGKIGQRLARYAKAFDMPVLVWGSEASRAAAQADGHQAAASREAFFAESDILTLNLRLSDSTRHGVTFEDLSRMKSDALLVNVSRAELIAPGALLDALNAGRPGYAAIDVYEQEPLLDTDDALLNHPRALCTPHLGYVEKNGYELYFGDAFDNVLAFFAGAPQNVANPEALSLRRD
ncbi:D-2-hydroxyacid dehydrogenase family protein [Enterobacterales bacterium AE_CKDN230030158-1A_HGKHYDSX7]